MDQSRYKKGGDCSDTTWDINYTRYIWVISRAASQLCTAGRTSFHLLNGCSLVGTKERRPVICFEIVTLITVSQQYRVLISPQCISKDIPKCASRQVELFSRGRNWTDTKTKCCKCKKEPAHYSQEGGKGGGLRCEAKKREKSRIYERDWEEKVRDDAQKYPKWQWSFRMP